MKLAYVDDDTDARSIVTRKLNEAGHPCDVFGTAEELLLVIVAGTYDCLIIDIRLPGCSGIALLKALRERGVFTSAILITAFNSVEYSRDALNASANYLLEKPFSFVALTTVIKNVLAEPHSLQECVDRGLALLDLTSRENELARLMLKGLSNKEIAQLVRISEKTVKQHISQLFEKARVASRAEFFSSIFPT